MMKSECLGAEMRRKHYTEEFKHETVCKLIESGIPVSKFAEKIDIEHTILHRWLKKYKNELKAESEIDSSLTKELNEIKNEIESIKDSVEVLRNIVKRAFGDKYAEKV